MANAIAQSRVDEAPRANESPARWTFAGRMGVDRTDGGTAMSEQTSLGRHGDQVDRSAEWDDIRRRHLAPAEHRPASTARGTT